MKTVFVFSTRNDDVNEFENIWQCCPAKQMEAEGKVVIGGGYWELVAFNGRIQKYYDGQWSIDLINSELTAILAGRESLSLGIVFHGTEGELSSVMDGLQIQSDQAFYSKSYTSAKGTFFRKFIKPFSSDGSDTVFETLWSKLKGKEPEVFPKEEAIGAAKHQMKTNFVMALKTVQSFTRNPTEEEFGMIHQLLLDTGSLERADEILSGLKAECEDGYLRDHPEIARIDKSLRRVRSFLESGFEPDSWTKKHLDEFKKRILYLSDRK